MLEILFLFCSFPSGNNKLVQEAVLECCDCDNQLTALADSSGFCLFSETTYDTSFVLNRYFLQSDVSQVVQVQTSFYVLLLSDAIFLVVPTSENLIFLSVQNQRGLYRQTVRKKKVILWCKNSIFLTQQNETVLPYKLRKNINFKWEVD